MTAFDTGEEIVNTKYIVSVGPIKKNPSTSKYFMKLTLSGHPDILLKFPDEKSAKKSRKELYDLIDAGAGTPL
jgi:hypothetical protein